MEAFPITLTLGKIKGPENSNDNSKALTTYLFAPRTQDLTAHGRDLQVIQVKMVNCPKPCSGSM